MRTAFVLIAATLLAAPAAMPAFASDGGKRAFACNTRGGNEITGRRFVMDDGRYGPVGDLDRGSYSADGDKVYFSGGALDGHQALRLPDGRLRLSRKIFCVEIEPPVQEAAAVPPPAPKPAPRPEPKLIIVKPGAH
ncbi:hypothetical protein sos41_19360 [Alphaproteobacteria bacterium SO-S41]|nr:hypothetical protein sos41_19360 [Alphaproteobacteria bacterium SO-S41]